MNTFRTLTLLTCTLLFWLLAAWVYRLPPKHFNYVAPQKSTAVLRAPVSLATVTSTKYYFSLPRDSRYCLDLEQDIIFPPQTHLMHIFPINPLNLQNILNLEASWKLSDNQGIVKEGRTQDLNLTEFYETEKMGVYLNCLYAKKGDYTLEFTVLKPTDPNNRDAYRITMQEEDVTNALPFPMYRIGSWMLFIMGVLTLGALLSLWLILEIGRLIYIVFRRERP